MLRQEGGEKKCEREVATARSKLRRIDCNAHQFAAFIFATSRHRVGLVAATLIWVLVGTSIANSAVTLPLDGYCKPGRYFPIRVDGSDAGRRILFSADGCLPTQIAENGSSSQIVPMLVTGTPHELDWDSGKIPLHVTKDDEVLVACTNADDLKTIADAFHGRRLIPVRLNTVELLPGPPVVWETLDAIVLNTPLFQRISDAQRSTLLAGGVKLISIGNDAPDNHWPWKKAGSKWVLSCPITGPNGDVVNENIYAPTYTWAPGWSAAIRGQVMGIATLLVLITTALMLRPNRITYVATMSLCILTTIGIILWRDSLGSVDRAGGDIVIANSDLLQQDAFVYERARENSTQTIPWSGWAHPLFPSDAELSRAGMVLDYLSNNQLCFTYQALRGHTMAFLHRAVIMGSDPFLSAPSTPSPMEDAAKLDYLNSGNRIVGETPESNSRWAGVLIESKKIQAASSLGVDSTK